MKIPLEDWCILTFAFIGSLVGFIYNGNPLSFGVALLTGTAICIAAYYKFSK